MPPLVLRESRSGASAQILPELGFNCFRFQAPVAGRMVDVVDAEADFAAGGKRPSGSGIPLLFPFPNRIRQGRFRWADRDYQLPQQDAQGNAIHGFVLDRPWRVTQQGEHFAVGEFQLSRDAPDRLPLWPADFLIEVRYELADAALHSDIRVVNPGPVPLPWGFGTHAYFRVPLSPQSQRDDCLIQAPATEAWELIDCLPTGQRLPLTGSRDLREGHSLAELKLDDVLTGLEPNCMLAGCGGANGATSGRAASKNGIESVLMDPKAGFQVSQVTGDVFRELVVYTPPHGRSVCMEPYTCVTDAINLAAGGVDAGWRTLPPGAEWTTRITIAAGLVIA